MVYTTNHKINKFSDPRKRDNGRGKLYFGTIIGLVFVLSFYFLGNPLSRFSINVLLPIKSFYNSISSPLGFGLKFLESKSNLISQNEILKTRVAELEANSLDGLALSSENNVLNNMLSGSLVIGEKNFVSTFAVSFPPQTPFGTILINKGYDVGIKENDKIFLSDRIMVGNVELVTTSSAKVKLVSYPGLKTEAILDRTGEDVEAVGTGGSGLELQLPKGSDVIEGDLLVLPGLPKVIIAKVLSIKDDESSPFIKVFLSLPLKITGNTPLFVEIK